MLNHSSRRFTKINTLFKNFTIRVLIDANLIYACFYRYCSSELPGVESTVP